MSPNGQVEQLSKDLSQDLPKQLVERLLKAYEQIKKNFYLGRHEPAELNGAKFCEVIFRILESETGGGKYTPLGTRVQNLGERFRSFESVTAANESVRFHIPRVAIAIYNIRNKRGVGHVGGDVVPNLADASFVCASADWLMAELVRLHYHCSLEEAQQLVDRLVQRKILLVYKVGNRKRVLNPSLTYAEQTLVLLAGEFPHGVRDQTLWEWTGHSHFQSYKRDVLKPLHGRRLIDYSDATCTALPTGVRVVEDNFAEWSDFVPKFRQ